MGKIKFIEVASELAAGTRGASLGIGALKTASLNKGSQFFKKYPCLAVPTINDTLFDDVVNPYAKRIPQVRQMLERTCQAVTDTLTEGYFPVVLGGDHSTAAGTMCGIKAALPAMRLGVIWIDAHADLHTPFTTPSGNMHGMPLAMVAGLDNLECAINDPRAETIAEWEAIKNIGLNGPKINPSDIVFISMRDREAPERALVERYGMRNFEVEELRSKGAARIVEESMQALQACDVIYVSFDVDSLDPQISRGTGTPVPGGLTVEEALELNSLFVKQPKVQCWEMVEINPTLDTHNQMAEVAFEILQATVKARSANGQLIGA
ncbi:arginase [Cesiribacter andamanensis]|uniref:Arginase n=1 Tax=Cesiribacter andamanensis AMV16 TaxID=1279009 RepID=M7NCE8_9BACT|nr:arginase [Cesiribacter andamanensis]EMR04831.1 Arginase [Cesiribacter andamanensis AMV16]